MRHPGRYEPDPIPVCEWAGERRPKPHQHSSSLPERHLLDRRGRTRVIEARHQAIELLARWHQACFFRLANRYATDSLLALWLAQFDTKLHIFAAQVCKDVAEAGDVATWA